MTRPKDGREPFIPRPLSARALMDDLNDLYAEIQRREHAEDLAAQRARRLSKRPGKRAEIASRS